MSMKSGNKFLFYEHKMGKQNFYSINIEMGNSIG